MTKLSHPKNPWLTNELKLKLKYRDVIYKRARKTGDPNLLTLLKNLKSVLKLILNSARDDYLKNALTNEAPGSNIWIKLKRLGIVKSRQSFPRDHFDAEQLNNFYASTLTKYPSSTSDFVTSIPSRYHSNVNCEFSWTKILILLM